MWDKRVGRKRESMWQEPTGCECLLPSMVILEKHGAQFCPRKLQLWLSSGMHLISSCERDVRTALYSCVVGDGWCFPGRALSHLASTV